MTIIFCIVGGALFKQLKSQIYIFFSDRKLAQERMAKLKQKRQLVESTILTESGTKPACTSQEKPKPMLTRRKQEALRRKWRQYKRNYR